MKRSLALSLLPLTALAIACSGSGDPAGTMLKSDLPDSAMADPVNPAIPPPTETPSQAPKEEPAPTPAPADYSTAVLLFNGTGVSTSDWQSTEAIVKSMGLSYRLANTAQLEAMSVEQLATYGLLLVPGGSGGTIYTNLSAAARLRIRQAVRDHGVNYLGFCAGAWVGVGPEAETDTTASYGFAVAKGSVLSYWYPSGNSSAIAEMVDVSFATGTRRSLVWWGGPASPEWSGGVVARYADGKAAISQRYSGKGFVIVSGPHPEAPQSWRNTAGADPDGLDFDIAKVLIQAALTQTPLKAY